MKEKKLAVFSFSIKAPRVKKYTNIALNDDWLSRHTRKLSFLLAHSLT